ncbi:MAG: PASTA domain-containing protein [Bacteroidia bacterium]|nr:MAG: PASTA domain-containing protein [Bacteroidia bacterium]
MDFLRFLITKKFLRHLGLAAAIAIILLLGTLLWLKIYTHHGKTITVPDLTGLTVEEVEDVSSSRHLRFEVIDSVFSNEMPRGTVIKHNPSGNSRVKKNRKIFLTMNAVNQEMIAMPQLVGLSFRQAKLAMQNAGLIQGTIEYRPDYAKNNVLQQKHNDSVIKEGTEITKGSVIDLVLGMGLSSSTTRIPNLVGTELEEAREIIARYYLNLGAVTYDESFQDAEDSLGAFIWRQYPEFDEFRRLNMGMEMDIWLSLDSTLLPRPDSTLFGDDTEIVDE